MSLPMPVYNCPTTPASTNRNQPSRYQVEIPVTYVGGSALLTIATADYLAPADVQMPVVRYGGSMESVKVAGVWGPREQENLPAVRRLADATDGLSNTALVVEQCATHEDHRLGREPSISGDHPFHSWINESDKGSYVTIGLDGRYAFVSEGTLVNGANGHNLYSFHTGGVQIAVCDGSVQFVAESTDWRLVGSLITAEGQEPITAKTWK